MIEHAHSYTQVTEQERRVHVNELETEAVACMLPIAPSSPILPPSWGPALSGRKNEPKQAHLNESQSERQTGRSSRSEVPHDEHYVLTRDNDDLVLISRQERSDVGLSQTPMILFHCVHACVSVSRKESV